MCSKPKTSRPTHNSGTGLIYANRVADTSPRPCLFLYRAESAHKPVAGVEQRESHGDTQQHVQHDEQDARLTEQQ